MLDATGVTANTEGTKRVINERAHPNGAPPESQVVDVAAIEDVGSSSPVDSRRTAEFEPTMETRPVRQARRRLKAIGCAFVAIGFVAVVGVAVIAGTRVGSSGTGAVMIVLEEYRFTPNRIDARVGVPITLILTNRGTERHDLNFASLHMPGLVGVESILAPGETRTITLTFDQPGIHPFTCDLPGHAAAGMTGAVYVTP